MIIKINFMKKQTRFPFLGIIISSTALIFKPLLFSKILALLALIIFSLMFYFLNKKEGKVFEDK
jgi:hypothetical protein